MCTIYDFLTHAYKRGFVFLDLVEHQESFAIQATFRFVVYIQPLSAASRYLARSRWVTEKKCDPLYLIMLTVKRILIYIQSDYETFEEHCKY